MPRDHRRYHLLRLHVNVSRRGLGPRATWRVKVIIQTIGTLGPGKKYVTGLRGSNLGDNHTS